MKNNHIKIQLVLSIIFLLSIGESFCQNANSFSVSGTVIDNNGSAMDFSIISIYSIPDSVKIDATLTDENGEFIFSELKNGSYFLKFSYFNTETVLIPVFNIENDMVKLGNIVYNTTGVQLNEIVIKSSKPAIKRFSDHVDLDIRGSYLTQGSFQIFEILNLLPNVDASEQNIKIKNSSGILYLINGRGNRSTNEINKIKILNLSNKEIEKIEVYTNPPARFDADGSSVLNVITVKNSKISSVQYGSKVGFFQQNHEGNSHNNRISMNLNYKLGKLGLFNTMIYSIDKDIKTFQKDYLYKELSSELQNKTNSINTSQGGNFSIGGIYELNNKNELSFDYSFDSNRFADSSRYYSDDLLLIKTAGISDSVLHMQSEQNYGFSFNRMNVGWWHKNNKKSIDFQAYYDGYFNNESGLDTWREDNHYYSKEVENNYAAMFNYQDTIFNSIEFRSGVKAIQTVSKENVNNYYNKGDFYYFENLKAGYGQLSGKIFNFDWSAGLRIESTSWGISLPIEKKGVYTNFFPSFFLNKQFKIFSINTSYTRRIQRQSISELNPLIRLNTNVLTIFSGNIDVLKPQLFDSYELNFDFSFLNFSAFFNRTKNPRIYFPESTDSFIINYLPQSAQYEETYGLSLKIPINIKMFRINISYTGNLVKSSLLDNTTNLGYSNNLVLNLNVRVKNRLGFNTHFRYVFPEHFGYYHSKSSLKTYFGMNYNKEGSPFTFSFNILDIFGSRYHYSFNYPNLKESSFGISLERSVQLLIRYNFKLGREFKTKDFEGINR